MKQSIVAQQLVQEFLVQPAVASKFVFEDLSAAVYDFLHKDAGDGESTADAFLMQGLYADREAAMRVALGRSPRWSRTSEIIAMAQAVMDWPGKADETPEVKEITASKKVVTKKKTSRRTGS